MSSSGHLFGILMLLIHAFLAAANDVSFRDRIRVEPNRIFIKYKHEIKGRYTGFHQTVDTSAYGAIQPSDCSHNAFVFCLRWGDRAQFTLTRNDNCEDYEYTTKQEKPISVSFDITNVHLYGGPEQDFQKWPMDYDEYEEYPYVSQDQYTKGVLEPYWLVSTGLYLYVDEKTPLFVTQHKSKGVFKLTANRKAPYIRAQETILKYRVCKFKDMKKAHKHAIDHVLCKPYGIPDKKMVRDPVWSTWSKYKAKLNHTVVMEFADSIKKNNLPNSQLVLGDKWETCYGSLEINKKAFPDMNGLVDQLKNMGFRVTVWVHPFINEDCEPYHTQAKEAGYLVKNGSDATVVDWWNGKGSVVDFTNPKAVKWWTAKLRKIITETGIHSYTFDAGESEYSPQVPKYHHMAEDHPETHLKAYVETVSQFGDMVEVRSSRGTQKYPIFVRMINRDTNWDQRLGLSTLIPTLLQMNIIGYPFVLPDMIGGNGYDDASLTKEMFIRWLQINVFMPALHFSFPPWDYDEYVVTITRKFIDLHTKYADKIIEAMVNTKETGTPANLPIWWVDPLDPIAQNIGSEFLLGEDILVAPVIEPSVRSRDIYLPRGIWRDEVNKDSEPIKGPLWLYNYPVDLETLPYFTKIKDIDDSKNSARSLAVYTNSLICISGAVTFYNFNLLF